MGPKNGDNCWWCGKPLDETKPDEFRDHMSVQCPDQNWHDGLTYDDDSYIDDYGCRASRVINGRRFKCNQKTHPSNLHNGKWWNKQMKVYEFESWEI